MDEATAEHRKWVNLPLHDASSQGPPPLSPGTEETVLGKTTQAPLWSEWPATRCGLGKHRSSLLTRSRSADYTSASFEEKQLQGDFCRFRVRLRLCLGLVVPDRPGGVPVHRES